MELRQAALASPRGTPINKEEVLKHEEALMLEATERNLDLDRLETRE